MKIDGIHPYGQSKIHPAQSVKGTAERKVQAPKDQLEISAASLERMKELQEEVDPLRNKKIEALRQSVEAGTYRVPAGKVADKLIAWWLGR